MSEEAKYIAENEPLDSDQWKYGSNAKFLRISSLWGVKFYNEPKIREYTWNLQNIAAKKELAPPVGDWIESHILGFGYLTMIADIEKHKDSKDIRELNEKLKEIGLHPDSNDCSAMKNAGYFKSKLVSVDFEANWMCFLVNGGLIQKIVQSGQPVDKDIGKRLNWRYTTDKEC